MFSSSGSNSTNRSTAIFLTIGILIMCGIALVMGYKSHMSNESLSWLPTQATILSTGISTGKNHRNKTTYIPEITYNYRDSQKVLHTNDRIAFFATSSTVRSNTEQVIADYPVSSQPIIYYNPKNPNQSILKKAGFWRQIPIISSVLLALLAVLYIFRLVLHRKMCKHQNFPTTQGIISSINTGYSASEIDLTDVDLTYIFSYKGKEWNGKRVGFQTDNQVAINSEHAISINSDSAQKF